MKLQTSIKPRRDGKVTVTGLDGKAYLFEVDAQGDITGDVEHEETVAHLLAGGRFAPVNEEDFSDALKAMNAQQEGAVQTSAAAQAAGGRASSKKKT